MDVSPGVVYLVGAGPGDPGLITRRGARLLRAADVVIHDGLVNDALLDLAPPGALCIYAGKKRAPSGQPLTQADIDGLLVDYARAGKRVVRLKGGDSFVFGRGAEECIALCEAGIDFEIVPGVTAATAVPAYAGIPLTARGVASTVAFATGHEAAGKPSSHVDWQALAHAGTIVLFMAVRTMADCCAHLIAAGKPADTPAAVIRWGTTPAQRALISTLRDLPAAARDAGIEPPALVVVGPVVDFHRALSWYQRRPLYGARIAVTRSLDAARDIASAIAERAGEPIVLPVTRIASVSPSEHPGIGRAIEAVSTYDWILFTSANAVDYFLDLLACRGRDARALASARIACVGQATATALSARALIADIVSSRGTGRGLADAVIDAAADAIIGARVLFPRALAGRDEAVDALRRAGAHVDVAPVYRTERTPPDDTILQRGIRKLQTGRVQVLAFFAPSQVDALFDLLGPDAREIVRACPLVAAIGPTTRDALERRGVSVDVMPDSPRSDTLVRAIAHAWHIDADDPHARVAAPPPESEDA